MGEEHEKDVKQAKEMKVTSDVNFRNVIDYVGVYMQAMVFNKNIDKFNYMNWFMVTHNKDMNTSFNTLVQVNYSNVITKQGVRSNFP